MKIAVYAIAKNESQFVDRWYDSMQEADGIFVLDTGSTDGTPDLLRKRGAVVAVQCQEPFKFNVARNASLALVPNDYDWCVCTDIDEVFSKGWRKTLEDAINDHPEINSALCKFYTAFDENGKPVNSMDYWKIHRRHCVHWESQVHEYLAWDEPRVQYYVEGMWLEHHPNDKPRDYYLPMLDRAVREERTARHLFYYGRELMYRGHEGAAIAVLMEYLYHRDSTWNSERAWAMRFIARCLAHKAEYNLAIYWYVKAAEEAHDQRESLVEYARMCASLNEYEEAVRALEIALQRKERPRVFFTEEDCWDGTPERLLAEYKKHKEEKSCSNG